eukprot:g33203.t1
MPGPVLDQTHPATRSFQLYCCRCLNDNQETLAPGLPQLGALGSTEAAICLMPGIPALGIRKPGVPDSTARLGHRLIISPSLATVLSDVTSSNIIDRKKVKKKKKKEDKK